MRASLVCWFVTFAFCLRSGIHGQAQPSPHDHIRVAAAVVQLLAIGPGASDKNRACSATGFFVNEDGYILTNAHVVEDARRCLAGSPGAKMMAKLAGPDSRAAAAVSCDVVAIDDAHDLALLKTERPPPGGVQFNHVLLHPEYPPVGTPVLIAGHAGFAWEPQTDAGKVIRRGALRLSTENGEKSEILVVNIPLKIGSSGSPVCLAGSGAVVGVVARCNPARPSESLAIPIRYAVALLDRHEVRWQRSAP